MYCTCLIYIRKVNHYPCSRQDHEPGSQVRVQVNDLLASSPPAPHHQSPSAVAGHCTPEWKVIVEPHGPRYTAPWSLVPVTAATITNCQWKSGCGDTGTLAGDRSNNPDTSHCHTKINGDHLHQQQTFLRPPNNNSQPYLHTIEKDCSELS